MKGGSKAEGRRQRAEGRSDDADDVLSSRRPKGGEIPRRLGKAEGGRQKAEVTTPTMSCHLDDQREERSPPTWKGRGQK
jgi:hypothetical protein